MDLDLMCNSLWAKKNETNGKFYWLPLIVHLEDTMNVIGWLYNHWLTKGQRNYLLGQIKSDNDYFDEDSLLNLVFFLGAIHDIGKATPVFQTQKSFASSPDLDHAILEKLERAGFTGISELVLASPKETHHTIAGELLLHQYGLDYDITSIIGAHHGKPCACLYEYNRQKAYPANYFQSENSSSEVALKWKKVQRLIYEWALEESGMNENEFPKLSEPAQVILSGLIIMADWIASNERYFPLFELSSDASHDLIDRFKEGMLKWFKNLPFDELNIPDNCNELYETRFGFSPRKFQKTIFETIDGLTDPGIMIIEAPMGCGKTEAALASAEQMAAQTGRSGLFFGLPTQATSNGIFPRVLHWTKSLSEEYGKTSIRLVHGKAALNKEMQELRDRSAKNVDQDEENGSVIINEWFSGRKTTALDDFVVGTVDQFLLMALKQKHLMLRHLGFSKKVIVIDEVHAYDAYMQQYLEEAIRWAGAYRIPVILLSATLPSKTRQSLINAYMLGKGIKKKSLEKYDEMLRTTAYPLITYSDGLEIRLNKDIDTSEGKSVKLINLDEDDLYDKLETLTKNGEIIGVIVNTVKRAQMIALRCIELFGEEAVELIHANYIAADRVAKEEKITHMIGKNADRPKMKIIIGTQVLEQSIDIDFDVMITDLCPMDLLIQRLGRLHRHSIVRPIDHQEPVVYVMGQSEIFDFDEGSEAVYGGYLLAKTQMNLPEEINIPIDIPKLVSLVYDQENDAVIANDNLKEKYVSFEEEENNRIIRRKNKASIFQIDNPKKLINPSENNLIGWLNMSVEVETEEKAYAQVRDIEETVEVIAVKKRGEGYSVFQSNEDIADNIDNPEIGRLLAQQTIRLPQSLSAYGKIDTLITCLEKYNREWLPEWQNNVWLKGALGIIFDENNRFRIEDKVLEYDSFLGLRER